MNREDWIRNALEEMKSEGLLRSLRTLPSAGGIVNAEDVEFLNFSSNDYLGLASHPAVVEAAANALRRYGAGSTASRLVTGTLPIHEELESQLAEFKGYPASLVFSSGYATNAGVVPSIAGRNDVVLADRLVHASLLDAATLSRARLQRFQHNDVQHLEDLLKKLPRIGRVLIVTESVFSMDGDLAPLPELAAAADRHGAMLLIDEAHATGIFGLAGSGLIREHGLEGSVAVSMGTLSKALGGSGGFAACSALMRELLINRARSFIYSTAPPPAVLGAALGALGVLRESPDLGATLLAKAAGFRARLQAAGLNTMNSESQIVPVLIGDNARAVAIAKRLRDRNILTVAIRPPTVPAGTARLRLSVSLVHTEAQLEFAAKAIAEAVLNEGST